MKPDRSAIVAELWRRGSLRYALHADQRTVRDAYHASSGRTYVLCCSRRWGKSRLSCVVANEKAITQPGAHIKYAAPTMKMAREIVVPHMEELHRDAPEELRPKFSRSELTWEFPNGSRILLAGCDSGNAERLRGTAMDLGVLDEAGFMDDLGYVVRSILMPQTMTTGGRIFMASTPARTPTHEFAGYCLQAEAAGLYQHRTIYDAPHITPNIITEFMAESGGEDSSDWRREYLAEVVVDESIAVLPEFTRLAGSIVREVEPPPFRHALTAIDAGFEDLTVALFGYHHFDQDLLVIEDERVWHRQHSGIIAPGVLSTERDLWGEMPPVIRVLDADAIVRADMAEAHGLEARLPKKDDKHGAVNALRLALSSGRVAIHPRCKSLIAHCKGAVWNRTRTSFERAAEFGHYDAVDALIYMWRHLDRHSNPYPVGYGVRHDSTWYPNQDNDHALANVLRPMRRR